MYRFSGKSQCSFATCVTGKGTVDFQMTRGFRAAVSAKDDRIRVLAISPRFAPTNGADTHRLRLLLPHASAAGWSAEVLCVRPEDAAVSPDPWLETSLPNNVVVHRVRAPRLGIWGMNGLAQRAILGLYLRGAGLLGSGRFDLVFFSTTEFATHLLGPLWLKRFRVPFCMDFQDPWVNDFYRHHPDVTPPGGRIKYGIADAIHRASERYVLGECSGYMSVSATYRDDVVSRHGSPVNDRPWLIRPFPAEPAEMDRGACCQPCQGRQRGQTSQKVWRYVGRGGEDMARAARAFFMAWSEAMALELVPQDGIRFEAYGTSYATRGTPEKTLEPLAARTRVESFVKEWPGRLGYREATTALRNSDALVVFGSEDSSYTASKIYPYLLAQRPLLAIFHERSSVVSLMAKVGGGVCVTFNEGTSSHDLAAAILKAWFESGHFAAAVRLDRAALEPYTAAVQATEVGHWFREILADAHH